LPTNVAAYSRVSETKGTNTCFFIAKDKTNEPHMDAFAATIILKKMNHIALDSPLAASE
jgi:hypothetical protein